MGTITRNFANSLSNQQGVNPTFKNLMINGDMGISQWGAKTGATGDVANGQAGVDRFNLRLNATSGYECSLTQTTDVPAGQGFRNSLEWKTTTVNSSLGTSGIIRYGQRVEKQMLRTLNYGTASAEQTTLSFWIKSSLTGTFIAELWDKEHSKYNSQAFTVSSADTWEKKSVTFAGNTSDAFDLTSNANGMEVSIWAAAGTDFTSSGSTTGGAWNADATYRAGGLSNAFSTTNNATIEITGYQFEIGNTATDFEQIPFDISLRRCQRYLERIDKSSTETVICIGQGTSGSSIFGRINFATEKRVVPSATISDASHIQGLTGTAGAWSNASGASLQAGDERQMRLALTGMSGMTSGGCHEVRINDSNGYIMVAAEI